MDNNEFQASINNNAIHGETYQVDDFLNGIGKIDGVSSGRVIGTTCKVNFKDNVSNTRCTFPWGDHDTEEFTTACGNDVVTQYTIH